MSNVFVALTFEISIYQIYRDNAEFAKRHRGDSLGYHDKACDIVYILQNWFGVSNHR